MENSLIGDFISRNSEVQHAAAEYFRELGRYLGFQLNFYVISFLYFSLIWTVAGDTLPFYGISGLIYFLMLIGFQYWRFRIDRAFRELEISFGRYLAISSTFISGLRASLVILTAPLLVVTFLALHGPLYESVAAGIIIVTAVGTFYLTGIRHILLQRNSRELEKGEVRTRLEEIASTAGMGTMDYRVVAGSELKDANVYRAGIIRQSILITDYLYSRLTTEEAVAIMSRSIPSVSKRNSLKMLAVRLISFYAGEAMAAIGIVNFLFHPMQYLYTYVLIMAGSLLMVLGIRYMGAVMISKTILDEDEFALRYSSLDSLATALLKLYNLNWVPLSTSRRKKLSIGSRISRLESISSRR